LSIFSLLKNKVRVDFILKGRDFDFLPAVRTLFPVGVIVFLVVDQQILIGELSVAVGTRNRLRRVHFRRVDHQRRKFVELFLANCAFMLFFLPLLLGRSIVPEVGARKRISLK